MSFQRGHGTLLLLLLLLREIYIYLYMILKLASLVWDLFLVVSDYSRYSIID